jgi:hypothetical protein
MRVEHLLSILGLALLAGCGGETNATAIQKYAPKIAPLRAKLASIARRIDSEPPVVSDTGVRGLTPAPSYNSDPETTNAAVLNLEQVHDPDVEISSTDRLDFGLYGNNDLRDALVYTGPQCPWGDEAKNQPGDRLSRQCERALLIRYLLVIRTVAYQKPVATGEGEFAGGEGRFEGFLVDLADEKIVGRVSFRAGPVSSVEFEVIKGKDRNDDPQGRMVAGVQSLILSDGQKKLVARLEQATGGKFDFGSR